MLLLISGISTKLYAHVVVGELEKMSKTAVGLVYLQLGYQHILPLGFDHILFVLCLLLLSPRLKPVLWQATAFTLAHSVTLGLTIYHVITPPERIVEPVIALSIMYVALENILSGRLKTSRIGVVFLFGLIHGMGFAGALEQLGLPRDAYLISLIMFNAGIELGQLTIILTAYFLLVKWLGNKPYYPRLIVPSLSIVIIIIAGYWTVQRLFL